MSVNIKEALALMAGTKQISAVYANGLNLDIYKVYSPDGSEIMCEGGQDAKLIAWAINNVRALVHEVQEHREDLDLVECSCVGCRWEGLSNPIDLCPECYDCLEIK